MKMNTVEKKAIKKTLLLPFMTLSLMDLLGKVSDPSQQNIKLKHEVIKQAEHNLHPKDINEILELSRKSIEA